MGAGRMDGHDSAECHGYPNKIANQGRIDTGEQLQGAYSFEFTIIYFGSLFIILLFFTGNCHEFSRCNRIDLGVIHDSVDI